LNTVLDDNRILTLANAQRIPMSDTTKMTFEVENLNNASPATVSRCGIIYVSDTDLFWRPLVETWLKDRVELKSYCNPDETAWMTEFTDKYIQNPNTNNELNKSYHFVMPCPELCRINHLINLMTAILNDHIAAGRQLDKGGFERLFIYCLSWSFAGLFEQEDREKFHKFLDSKGAPLPPITPQKL
jgi:dynein heavy chain